MSLREWNCLHALTLPEVLSDLTLNGDHIIVVSNAYNL